MRRRPLLMFAFSFACLPVARGHHGWSSFDQTRPIWLSSRAASVQWSNPHAALLLELPEARSCRRT